MIVAVPDAPPALNVTIARPLMSVAAPSTADRAERRRKGDGVPLCGGVPPASITCAMMSVVPFTGSAVAAAVSVIVEPDGASSGTFWQAGGEKRRRRATARRAEAAEEA